MSRFTPKGRVMINSAITLTEFSLVVEREEIDVTPAMHIEPDMKWTHTDARGHFHAFSKDERDPLPTLRVEIIEHGECDECRWEERIFKCVLCEEVVEPRYTEHPAVWKEFAPGPMSWRLDVTAYGSDTLKMTDLHQARVSLRIQTDEGNVPEYFGIGVVFTGSMEFLGDGSAWVGRILGVGPLGSRDA